MKGHLLQRKQLIKQPLDEVFSFFARPENILALMPTELKIEFLTPSPIEMKPGTVIDYLFYLRRFPVRWTSLVEVYEPPSRFVYLQLRGPFSYWRHTHTFEETREGIWVWDEVHYLMPWGPLGRLAHRLFVERDLEWVFEYREKATEQMFTECSRRKG